VACTRQLPGFEGRYAARGIGFTTWSRGAFPAVAMTTRSMDPPGSPARPPRGGRIHLSKSVQPRLANGSSTHSWPDLRSKSGSHGPMNGGPNVSLAPIEGITLPVVLW